VSFTGRISSVSSNCGGAVRRATAMLSFTTSMKKEEYHEPGMLTRQEGRADPDEMPQMQWRGVRQQRLTPNRLRNTAAIAGHGLSAVSAHWTERTG
jgi:hypothetical protein